MGGPGAALTAPVLAEPDERSDVPKRTCSIEGCEGTHSARGWCNRHYQRWLRWGDPTYSRPKFEPEHGTTTKYRRGCRCETCSEAGRAAARAWQQANRDRHRAVADAWVEAHPDRVKTIKRKWYLANSDRVKTSSAAWLAEHPSKGVEFAARRRARKLEADTRRVTDRDWNRLCARYRHRCAYCGKRRPLERDHVVPLVRGGRHSIGNLLPACRPCNSSKHSKLLTEWRAQRLVEGLGWSLNPG